MEQRIWDTTSPRNICVSQAHRGHHFSTGNLNLSGTVAIISHFPEVPCSEMIDKDAGSPVIVESEKERKNQHFLSGTPGKMIENSMSTHKVKEREGKKQKLN